ncbi:MAG: response regulator [Bacteroidetes bacterium]|nr:response regulator [Bacteroidota bacterium]
MKKPETDVHADIIDFAGVVILRMNKKGEILQVNKQACSLLGFKESELVGMNWKKIAVEQKDDYLTRDQPKIPSGFPGEPGLYQDAIALRTHAGDIRFLDFKLNQDIQDGTTLLVGYDVSAYVLERNELRQSKFLYSMLAGSVPDVNLFLFDRKMRFIIAKGSEMKNHGLNSGFFEGKRLADLADKRLYELYAPLFKLALEGKEISTEYTYRNNNYMISVFPLRQGKKKNSIFGGMAITQNITQEKINSEVLSQAKKDAEEANKTKSEFLANISHEIRTPLSAIVGFAEQLLKTDLEGKSREYVEIIEKSSEQLLALVNDLLILSRIEAGRIDFDDEPFKIKNTVDYVYNAMKAKAEDKNIQFSYNLGAGMENVVVGDEFRLSQVLINLVSNAIKFTESGNVELLVTKEKEDVDHVYIRFKVKDTGVGIPENKVKIIFEQFRQADSAVTKKYGGTGLGLTISKRLVEMQNGTIEVKSKLGVGTTFTVVLPFERGDEKAHIENDYKGEAKRIRFTGKVALVVDDDSVNRLLGHTILTDLGFEVDMAGSGTEAIQKLHVNRYDVLVLDIHMPGVSGIEVAEFLRKTKHDHSTKILAVTAAFMKEDLLKYKIIGIDDYLIKPFRESKFYNKMCKILGYKFSPLKEKTKIDSKSHDQFFNLSELKSMAGEDTEFLITMLDTFIHNMKEGIDIIHTATDNSNWNQVGETAHKLIPSFEHLKVDQAVSVLKNLEKLTLHKPDYSKIPDLVKEITELSRQLLKHLNSEKESVGS